MVCPSATCGARPRAGRRRAALPKRIRPKRSPVAPGSARLRPAQDPPRDQPGDLHDADLAAVRHLDDQAVALVVLARLVQRGVEELARPVGDRRAHGARDGRAVHMAVEDAHEDATPGSAARGPGPARPAAPRVRSGDDAIGGADQKARVLRHRALRVAEEVVAPDGQAHADPAQRVPDPGTGPA
jgi:hypothetical protein